MDPATGLTNMQQRYYDQGVGRFLSVDPVSASSINGGNFNRYWYANNNPYKFNDPDGRLPHIAAGAIVGAVIGGGYEIGSQVMAGRELSWDGVRDVFVEAGKGAAVGAAVAATGGAAAAAITSVRGGAVATGAAVGGTSALAAGTATLIASPIADVAKGDQVQDFGEYRDEALVAAAGGAAGGAVGGALVSKGGQEVVASVGAAGAQAARVVETAAELSGNYATKHELEEKQ